MRQPTQGIGGPTSINLIIIASTLLSLSSPIRSLGRLPVGLGSSNKTPVPYKPSFSRTSPSSFSLSHSGGRCRERELWCSHVRRPKSGRHLGDLQDFCLARQNKSLTRHYERRDIVPRPTGIDSYSPAKFQFLRIHRPILCRFPVF